MYDLRLRNFETRLKILYMQTWILLKSFKQKFQDL